MEMFESYLKEINRYPLLDSEEESELAKKIQLGDQEAKKKLINCNLRLVVSIAKKFNSGSGYSSMDLIQEGNIALMTAASKYEVSFNTRFSTYAYPWVLQYMIRYINSKSSMISLPNRKEELLRKISSFQNNYMQTYGKEASLEEISRATGIDENVIYETYLYSYSISSLDVPVSDESNGTVGDLIPDNRFNPEEIFFAKEDKTELKKLIDSLPAKERTVIYGRYNFHNELHVPTLRELSQALGVSAETVRQMEMRAVNKIRKEAVVKAGNIFIA